MLCPPGAFRAGNGSCDRVGIESLVVTDTIPLNEKAASSDKVKVLSIAELVGEAIIRCHQGDSVTSLFV